ncbi:zinc-binding alcohol dehydrogenase family protein [Candidatus Sodalis endolongispinus]|uniref:Zinc-type alcohol dehydrogenase-like protein n=1 Tax=Candidatus Sodalis endolongispinus TaxID=2812662 RepID=A0ABS5YD96_9GAMM|nr:zinc-binding alcohol dehydrogenase family protein [Candidatus Sodalis endolongispinus]MBT9432928.1 zinc-binding alcohol dehydrogenase family protein [Candidatus Sodalis endolongispinus]
MHAFGFYQPLPITAPDALVELDLPEPTLGDYDLLVEVKAIAVNPVDVKVRAGSTPPKGEARVPGWDAAGIVLGTGARVSRFAVGDRVWYAGDIRRAGSYAERQAVDERLVGPMPASLDFAEAAALPLTAITAWELLFDRLKVQQRDPAAPGALLVIGAAGGVGSILLQLARALTGLTLVATASRDETRRWVRDQGAHAVIDHSQPWAPQLAQQGITDVSNVIGLNHTASYIPQIIEVLAPEGQLALIDDPQQFDIVPFKSKSISVHWELMFTRSLYHTATQERQHALLRRVAWLVDQGVIRTTLTRRFDGITLDNLRQAHTLLEQGATRGKIVLVR